MFRFSLPWLASLLLLGLLPLPGHADELKQKIEELLQAPEYRHARWGILVVDAKTRAPLFAQNADQLFAPASVTKLYSCAAALAVLGPEHRFETPVHRRGEVVEGRLQGDLILVGDGDPTLGGRTDAAGKITFRDTDHTYANWLGNAAQITKTDPLAGLKELARQIKIAGIREVDGEVLIDDRLFNRERGSGSGPDAVTPIVVNDNVIDVLITPGVGVGTEATVEMHPKTDYYKMETAVHTAFMLLKPMVRVESPAPHHLKVTGLVPFGSKAVVRIFPVPDPAAYARALFIETLRGEGITVKASPLKAPRALLPEAKEVPHLPRVALFQSPPLHEEIKLILKVSHNLHASTLPLLLAVKNQQRSLAAGMRLQGKVLGELGVPVDTISLESGAGGGNGDRVTPEATVQLLLAMSRGPDSAVYRAALPVLGVDGTLAEVVAKTSPARGAIQAKTGTYVDVDLLNDRLHLRSKAMAGYMTTAKNRELTFAFFVNDVSLPRGVEPSREGKALGRLCEIIHQHAP